VNLLVDLWERIMIITDIKYLKQQSDLAIKEDYDIIISLLEEELNKVKDRGLGLSAIQIGYKKQIGLIKYGNNRIEIINPIIIEKYDKFRFKGESCLSLPFYPPIDTIRYKDITIETGFDRKQYCFYGIEAVAMQHEIDHMKGILITDRKWRKKK